jgi:tripartite-type tricarboxylate transporter receptor subunit TctC
MTIPRQTFLHLAAGAAGAVALPAVMRLAEAQDYPTRPVRVIVGFPAGSGPDIVGRIIGQALSERMGQSFVIEDRPGSASNIATEAVVRAAPDGYTLLLITTVNSINSSLYDKLNFNFTRDIAPVATIDREPFLLEATPSLSAKTVPELIAYAKANPGKITMASAGVGSAPHVFGELFKTMAGVDLAHVPYRGNPLPDLLSGQVQLFFGPIQSSLEYVRTGKLKALAATTARRLKVLPDVPVLADFVPGYEASGWLGVGVPKNTPPEVIERLNGAINAVLATSDVKARLASLGDEPWATSPSDFGKLIADEVEKWGQVIRALNIKVD